MRHTLLLSALIAGLLAVGFAGARSASRKQPTPARSTVKPLVLTPSGRVTNGEIDEMSGLARSRRFPDTFWTHNDSGDDARLFAIHRDGSSIAPADFPKKPDKWDGFTVRRAENEDWEDIAIDGATIYVADTGNNDNDRDDLTIYAVPEIDPKLGGKREAARAWRVSYPDQPARRGKDAPFFDCEAIFVRNGTVFLLTKQRVPSMPFPLDSTALYRLDNPTEGRANVLTKVDSRDRLGGWVTAADVSPDGKTLAVLCQAPLAGVWLFDATAPRPLSRPKGYLPILGARQCEALCFDNDSLLIGNEQRDLFRIPLRSIPPFQSMPKKAIP